MAPHLTRRFLLLLAELEESITVARRTLPETARILEIARLQVLTDLYGVDLDDVDAYAARTHVMPETTLEDEVERVREPH